MVIKKETNINIREIYSHAELSWLQVVIITTIRVADSKVFGRWKKKVQENWKIIWFFYDISGIKFVFWNFDSSMKLNQHSCPLFAFAIYRANYGLLYGLSYTQVSNTFELGSSRAFDCRPRFGTYGVTYERPMLYAYMCISKT